MEHMAVILHQLDWEPAACNKNLNAAAEYILQKWPQLHFQSHVFLSHKGAEPLSSLLAIELASD